MKRPKLEDLYKDEALDVSMELDTPAEAEYIEGELNMLDAMLSAASDGARLMPLVDTVQ